MGNFYTDTIQRDPRFNSDKRVADVNLLEPRTRAMVQQILAASAQAGQPLLVFETFRSQARQEALFNQGASTLKKVGVHHYGLACDIVKNVGGDPSWKGSFDFLRQLAKDAKLIWGGDWGTPKQHHSFVDSDHVQRVTIGRQDGLFAGTWYPDDNYDPYAELGS
jgi:hypothetical protein